jgi:hypothetical protein
MNRPAMRAWSSLLFAVVACGPGPRGGEHGPDASAVDGTPVNACKVQDDGTGVGMCTDKAPPDSFEPEIQWSWTGPNGDLYSIVTPLVANLTDDNADGEIDLCDTPDVVVVASPSSGGGTGHIYVLDGSTGTQHFMVQTLVDATVTPALGDINNDKVPDIVSVTPTGNLVAFHHDGSSLWGPAGKWMGSPYSGAIALADLDHDGNVEIIAGNNVFDRNGTLKWTASTPEAPWNATTAADLDGDGYLEVVFGAAAYRHDGTQYWATSVVAGYPQVANLDSDPMPEVLVTNTNGLALIEHDGTVRYQDLRPTGVAVGYTAWVRPATIHDFDGDGQPEYAMSSANYYTVYRADGTIKWSAPVSDQSGIAAGTAFDFLGDGTAEAMYADEHQMFVFNEHGAPIFMMPRTSGTLTEYPVVADIDNDGSAEIVVTSNQYSGTPSPTVQVIRDRQDRWIQARRIWNQHTYHVTNVREDGTIPQHEDPSWTRLNTFRTNAQINGVGVCSPIIL